MNSNMITGGSWNAGKDRSTYNIEFAAADSETPQSGTQAGNPNANGMKNAEEPSKSIGQQQWQKEIERAAKALEGRSVSLEYSVHKETQQIMVKLLNKDTGEVIREIPSEKALDVAARIMENAGIVVDERR